MSGTGAPWAEGLGAVAARLVPEDCCRGTELPSLEVLRGVVRTVRTALFAEQLGPVGLDSGARRAFVAASLEHGLAALEVQLGREPGLGSAVDVVAGLVSTLPEIRARLDSDLAAAVAGDPAALSTNEVLLCYPGFHAILHHRIAHELHRRGAPLVARAIAEIGHSATAVDIHPGATIGERFFIDHGTGVVIGETAIIGRGVRLYQGVTLGARSFPVDAAGRIIRGAARHPILEDDVQVFAGATILGRVTIGRGAVIGGGVWLTRDVAPLSRVLQAPARSSESFAHGAGI